MKNDKNCCCGENINEKASEARQSTANGPNPNHLTLATIKKGSAGKDVLFAQKMLYIFCQDLINEPITSDGIFGNATEKAAKIFQQKNGRAVDGIIGPATWQRLCPAVMAGYTPSLYWRADRAIRETQRLLVLGGYLNNTDIDGIFGTRTQNAIKAFQKRYGLTQDGAWGRQCWSLTEQGYF